MRSLAGDLRPVGAIEPAPAERHERVGPALGRRPTVRLVVPRPGVLQATQRGDHGLSRLGVQVSVDPDHAAQQRGDVQVAAIVLTSLSLIGPRGIGHLAPVADRRPELPGRKGGSCLDEHRFGLQEGLRG